MAEWAVLGAMIGGGAMETVGNIKGGREAKRQAYAEADELGRQTSMMQRQGLERMKEIELDRQTATGRVKGAAAKSGLRQGGSVKTLSQRVSEDFERRKLFLGLEFGERTRQAGVEIGNLRRQGRRAKQAGYWGAGKSLLSTGADVGEFGYKRGWFNKDSIDPDFFRSGTATPGAGRF